MWVALYEIPLNLDAYIDKKLLHSEDYEVGHIVSFYIAYYAYDLSNNIMKCACYEKHMVTPIMWH